MAVVDGWSGASDYRDAENGYVRIALIVPFSRGTLLVGTPIFAPGALRWIRDRRLRPKPRGRYQQAARDYEHSRRNSRRHGINPPEVEGGARITPPRNPARTAIYIGLFPYMSASLFDPGTQQRLRRSLFHQFFS
jgi:hypothetical protein